MKPIRLLSAFLTVGAWTLLSRILGFARDILIAAYLGAGPVAEAFLVAFSLPNMFRRFFAEGAFNTAFVPMFSKRVEQGEGALGFARDAFSGLAGVLIVFTLIAQLAMPGLVLLMASGFAEDQRFDLAVEMGRIAFPYILFISLAALLSGVLNATGRFVAAAAAPVVLNIILVAMMLGASALGYDIGMALAWGVPLAGIAQLVLLWSAAARAGFRLVPARPRLTPELRRLAVIAFPAALAGGVMQINLLVGRQVASFFDGAVAWLNYADRLYQLPLGVVGIAIGVVLLPDLSRRLSAGDAVGGREAVNRAAEFSLALSLPAAVALIIVPLPIVTVLFERGAFSGIDAAATAQAVAVYGAGLPAFVLLKVVQPIFFAREDTKTPFRLAVVGMVVNVAVAVGLAPVMGFLAAALGTTLAAWVNFALLWRAARQFGDAARPDSRLRRAFPRLALAAFGMGLALWASVNLAGDAFVLAGVRYIALAGLVAGGATTYAIIAVATGAVSKSTLRQAVRRG
ncbi:murein biosynthesis integral membrane protein MurJ [Pontivivens insulae]|uniref:Probable lipid II flippase MurJ n=1 Tax=Pontivivens insulae TaxID=1639689 RepID=A0A2R8AET8_9RHOB|nr:murein biosynthesis integral membrane protein MurJ [Pontivivens insulae]RED12005.1 putative peptidoglycan lipid II flippase [Pontivivens insulae]SPF30761.1 putative lipid II flippase MurJ [Pontivivens insulae]